MPSTDPMAENAQQLPGNYTKEDSSVIAESIMLVVLQITTQMLNCRVLKDAQTKSGSKRILYKSQIQERENY